MQSRAYFLGKLLLLSILLTLVGSPILSLSWFLMGADSTNERIEPLICAEGTSLQHSNQSFADTFHGEGISAEISCCGEEGDCTVETNAALGFLFLFALIPVGLTVLPTVGIGAFVYKRYGYRPVLWGIVLICAILIVVILV